MQAESVPTAQAEAEAQRYTRRNILRSERMYGRGFQSPGGVQAVEAFCRRLELFPGMRVLDVGSGLGGASMHLAARHGASVLGLDVSEAMVEISNERRAETGIHGVHFARADVRRAPLDPASFDLVWTRDCILYLADKSLVWERVSRCLRPGGQLFVTDFARGEGPLSEAFQGYLKACDYHLQTLSDYVRALEGAGLEVTTCEDATPAFEAGLAEEKARLAEQRASFLEEFEPSDYDYLVSRWDRKIAFCRSGELRWGLFVAQKR